MFCFHLSFVSFSVSDSFCPRVFLSKRDFDQTDGMIIPPSLSSRNNEKYHCYDAFPMGPIASTALLPVFPPLAEPFCPPVSKSAGKAPRSAARETHNKTLKKRLTFPSDYAKVYELSEDSCGLVAQLDRVFDYESKGRGFESRRAHFPEALKIKGSGVFLCFHSGAKNTAKYPKKSVYYRATTE